MADISNIENYGPCTHLEPTFLSDHISRCTGGASWVRKENVSHMISLLDNLDPYVLETLTAITFTNGWRAFGPTARGRTKSDRRSFRLQFPRGFRVRQSEGATWGFGKTARSSDHLKHLVLRSSPLFHV